MSAVLNTLFITTDGSWVHRDHETVVVSVDGQKRLQLPLIHLKSIVCLGRSSVSPDLMASCAEAGIHIAYFSPSGRFLARVEGTPGGNVLLRRAQHRAADDAAASLALARSFVVGKVTNERQYVLHARRDADGSRKGRLEEAGDRLASSLRAASAAANMEELRGIEGNAAKIFFDSLSLLLKRNEDDFRFEGRNRRPPRDRMNALLSFGYALLLQDCAGALAGVGLDPAVGYLHEDRPGRLGLALDLMEELRTPVVDRLVLALVNRGQIVGADFRFEPTGAVLLSDEARRKFLIAYQDAKQPTLLHSFLDQDLPWGQVPHVQAILLARTLRGDLPCYPPFSLR